MTSETFLILYPEFATAATELLDATLEQETIALAGVEGDLKEKIVGLQTAQTLALSPFARDLKLVNKDGSTVFDSRLRRALTRATIHRRSA